MPSAISAKGRHTQQALSNTHPLLFHPHGMHPHWNVNVWMQRLIESMDMMNLDAFIYPGWGNPPRLIGDLAQAGNTHLGTGSLPHINPKYDHACCLFDYISTVDWCPAAPFTVSDGIYGSTYCSKWVSCFYVTLMVEELAHCFCSNHICAIVRLRCQAACLDRLYAAQALHVVSLSARFCKQHSRQAGITSGQQASADIWVRRQHANSC